MRYFILAFIVSTAFAQTSNEIKPKYDHVEPIVIEYAPLKKVEKKEIIQPKEEDIEDISNEIPNESTDEISDAIPEKEIILDEDGDGVLDENDMCPKTPEGFQVSKDGCPQKATLEVYFQPNKYNIVPKMADKLESFATFLLNNPNYQVVLYGYTDSIGEDEENKILSQRRADSIKDALIELGISPTKLTAIGRGEENPVASNMYKIGREKNRRIEAELIY